MFSRLPNCLAHVAEDNEDVLAVDWAGAVGTSRILSWLAQYFWRRILSCDVVTLSRSICSVVSQGPSVQFVVQFNRIS